MTITIELASCDLELVLDALEFSADHSNANADMAVEDGEDDISMALKEEESETRRLIAYLQTVAINCRERTGMPYFPN